MRQVEIDWENLKLAFEATTWGMRSFLDVETGEVYVGADDSTLAQWSDADLSGVRYIEIPETTSREAYRDMTRFVETVGSRHLQDQLRRAIEGRDAVRYFKEILLRHSDEWERWFIFQERCVYERIGAWLRREGIEPSNPVEPPSMPKPEAREPPSRGTLIEDLTLLLIYLSSWEEEVLPGHTFRRAWKGYTFEVLDALEEKGLIAQARGAKSVRLTDEGVAKAQEIEQRYLAK